MSLAGENASLSSFSYENMEKLTEACARFYNKSLAQKGFSDVSERRSQLAKYVRKFHSGSGTLTPRVEEAIKNLETGSCLLLMTAHQPNLFPYSGVLRKATLNHVLAKRLSESLKVPVVSFFGIADQDFTDDRWVKSALLPDMERRGGLLKLRFDMPEKLMLNKIAKPNRKTVDAWREKIRAWIDKKLNSIRLSCKSLGFELSENTDVVGNFEVFWSLVEEAYERAGTYSDFNAYVMSKIVNEAWDYDTVFSRFSECQQIFEREFCFLLSRFDDYSRYVKEALTQTGNIGGGVYEQEFETAPFWYHCSCGSKARLKIAQKDDHLVGQGRCIRCNSEYQFDFGLKRKPQISEIVKKISARSISMPLVFFQGLGVGCYVGGAGGMAYLQQAQYVAEHLNTLFSPVVVWRPKDSYLGLGQLDALIIFRKLSGSLDFSEYSRVEDSLKKKILTVQSKMDELEAQKKQLCNRSSEQREELVRKLKILSAKQSEVRRESDFSVLMRNRGLLENVATVMNLYPCIVDYVVNIGLRQTSEQWIKFLQDNGTLSSNVSLRTAFDDIKACALPSFGR